MITMEIKLSQDSAGALTAEFLNGKNSVSQNNSGVNYVKVYLDGFTLENDEFLQIAYATSLNESDPMTESVKFELMSSNDGGASWYAEIPALVRKTRGTWYLDLRTAKDNAGETAETAFTEYSHLIEKLSFEVNATIYTEDGGEKYYPSMGDVTSMFTAARNAEDKAKVLEDKTIPEIQEDIKTLNDKTLPEMQEKIEAKIPTNLQNGEGEYSFKQRNAEDATERGFQLNNPSSPNDKGEFKRAVTGKNSALLGGDNSVSVSNAIVGGDGNVYDGAAAGRGIQGGRYNHGKGDDIIQGGSQNYTEANRTLQAGNLNKIKKGSYNSETTGGQNTIGENSQNSSISGLGNEIKDNCPYSRESGRNNKVNAPNQAVDGYFNKENAEAIYMVGNGDAPTAENGWKTTRKNAFEVLKDGRATVQSPPQKDIDVVRKLENDEKYDKTGGIIKGNVTIQGNLSVAGTTTTKDTETVQVKENVIVANSDGVELAEKSGFAVKTSKTSAYGILYDPVGDGVKIGLGAFDENGKFEFEDGEAQFLATRDDSIENGNLVEWNDEEKKLVDTGKKTSDFLPASAASGFIPTAAVGKANGVAPLDAGGAVPSGFLPMELLRKYGKNIRYGAGYDESKNIFYEFASYESPTTANLIEHSVSKAGKAQVFNPWTLYYDHQYQRVLRFDETQQRLVPLLDENKAYTKTQTDTAIKNAINDALSLLQGIREILPVASLPTENISTTTMYLVTEGDDAGTEYLYVNGKWEPIGSTKVDTSKLVTTDTEQEISGKKNFANEVEFYSRVRLGGEVVFDLPIWFDSGTVIGGIFYSGSSFMNTNTGEEIQLPTKSGTIATTDDCKKYYRHDISIDYTTYLPSEYGDGETVQLYIYFSFISSSKTACNSKSSLLQALVDNKQWRIPCEVETSERGIEAGSGVFFVNGYDEASVSCCCSHVGYEGRVTNVDDIFMLGGYALDEDEEMGTSWDNVFDSVIEL